MIADGENTEISLYGSRVIGNTIAFGSKILDVSEDLVSGWVGVVRRNSLMFDRLPPERIAGCSGSGGKRSSA